MAVLEFLRRKVRPAWTYKVQGIVWRIVPADPELIVGESRDIDKKLASFFCLDEKNGSPLWEGVSFEEKWWIGIEAIHGDRVLLHGFATPDMPAHKGITALDVFTGKTAWKNQELSFVRFLDDSVIASRSTMDGGSFLELDGRSGRILSDDLEGFRYSENVTLQPRDTSLTFPVPLTAVSERGAIIVQKHMPQEEIIGDAEVIENDTLLLLGYHKHPVTGGGEVSITDVLRVIDCDKNEIVYSDTLSSGASQIVPDMFFTRNGKLFYVKNRSELVAVRLDDLRR